MSNNTDRTQQQRNNSYESFVLDSGASGTYVGTAENYPAFDEESPTEGSSRRRQGNCEIFVAEFKNEFTRLISAGVLVQQQQHEHPADRLTRRIAIDGRIRQTYARHTTHVRPEQPSLHRIRVTAAGNLIQTADISSNYLHLPIDQPIAELPAAVRQRIGRANYARNYCHTHSQHVSHNANQCRNENVRRRPRGR